MLGKDVLWFWQNTCVSKGLNRQISMGLNRLEETMKQDMVDGERVIQREDELILFEI
jgi:hypothetical protein